MAKERHDTQLDNTFRKQQTRYQVGVMARRSHGDGNWLASDPDFERLFYGEFVRYISGADALLPSHDPSASGLAHEIRAELGLLDHTVRVDYKLLRGAFIEVIVPVRCVVERDQGDVH